MNSDTSVKVAVRIRPLNETELTQNDTHCISVLPNSQIIAGSNSLFTFDHVFGADSSQQDIYESCVVDLVHSAFEGFNATILCYGQTGSGKTWTMGSSADRRMTSDSMGIIPRVIRALFEIVNQKEIEDVNSSYKIQVQFLEIYGEDIKDLLDHTKTSKVSIREINGEVFVSGAREENVSSAAQMMKTLEVGTQHRTTASTMMNQESSRSHGAIIDTEKESNVGISQEEDVDGGERRTLPHAKVEVRKSKFHFVDLAGSERAKRTKAEGQQLKEGIDINKGLLALGNVISALGDEQKRGKVHVPYRDSKVTRILQDSLGGNSKTLFICCVSPAGINFNESINALRYANRARNIKNKPVVNRDPTLVMIDELKNCIQNIAYELLIFRRSGGITTTPPPNTLTDEQLERLSANTSSLTSSSSKSPFRGNFVDRLGTSAVPSAGNGAVVGLGRAHFGDKHGEQQHREVGALKLRVVESDFEVRRLSDQLKLQRLQASELAERIILVESERDFYKMKWAEVCPVEALQLEELVVAGDKQSEEDGESTMAALGGNSQALGPHAGAEGSILPLLAEKETTVKVISGYLREICDLKKDLARMQQRDRLTKRGSVVDVGAGAGSGGGADLGFGLVPMEEGELMLESELTSNMARVIAQTKEHLREESKKLRAVVGDEKALDILGPNIVRVLGEGLDGEPEVGSADGDGDDLMTKAEMDAEGEEKAFQVRQNVLTSEVQDLGQSILLKEQLLDQLQRSQHQYSVMKAFYEQKLVALEEEMETKQHEREKLEEELQEIASTQHVLSFKLDREQKLKEQLRKKDEELKILKKRQDELNSLSQVQSMYLRQVTKLETDIDQMKKQKVDMTKALQTEKKRHLTTLNDKVKEIERLKRELIKASGEVKRLGREKDRAEDKAREVMREGAMMRKRTNEMLKFVGPDSAAASARTARRALISSRAGAGGNNTATLQLTSEQLKTKKWLDKRISDINRREREAEALRQQCEQQLALVNQKEILQSQKLALEHLSDDPSDLALSGQIDKVTAPQGMLSLSDIDIAVTNARDSADGADSLENELLSLADLSERIESMDQQLQVRDRRILEMQAHLSESESPDTSRTAELLKRMAAGSLSAAHECIQVMFDMLVVSRRLADARLEALQSSEQATQRARSDLEDALARMAAAERQHEHALTRAMSEHEEKLHGLFNHSSVGQMVLAESRPSHGLGRGCFSSSPSRNDGRRLESSQQPNGEARDLANTDGFMALLVVAQEQNENLRGQLQRYKSTSQEALKRVDEVEQARSQLARDLEEKRLYVEFMEHEVKLFREMVSDLRSGIATMGGIIGGNIIRQVREKAIEKDGEMKQDAKFKYAHFHKFADALAFVEDDEGPKEQSDDDGDSESVLLEFDHLANEILRSGGLLGPAVGLSVTNAQKSDQSGKGVVERLTNPCNYTGSMKNVFNQDLATKREKVQRLKSNQAQNHRKDSKEKEKADMATKRRKEEKISSVGSDAGTCESTDVDVENASGCEVHPVREVQDFPDHSNDGNETLEPEDMDAECSHFAGQIAGTNGFDGDDSTLNSAKLSKVKNVSAQSSSDIGLGVDVSLSIGDSNSLHGSLISPIHCAVSEVGSSFHYPAVHVSETGEIYNEITDYSICETYTLGEDTCADSLACASIDAHEMKVNECVGGGVWRSTDASGKVGSQAPAGAEKAVSVTDRLHLTQTKSHRQKLAPSHPPPPGVGFGNISIPHATKLVTKSQQQLLQPQTGLSEQLYAQRQMMTQSQLLSRRTPFSSELLPHAPVSSSLLVAEPRERDRIASAGTEWRLKEKKTIPGEGGLSPPTPAVSLSRFLTTNKR